jgi:predicted nucleic acid-binding protein
MAAIIDASALLAAGRSGFTLEEALGADERVAIAAVTATQLLEAVARTTDPGARNQRAAFVERLLERVEVLAFDAVAARTYVRLEGDLGEEIPERELHLAAIALSRGWRLVTANGRALRGIPGLELVVVSDPSRVVNE